MAQVLPLTLANLPEVDEGKVSAMFDLAIDKARIDVDNNRQNLGPRTVTLTVDVRPDPDSPGNALVQFACKVALPPRRTGQARMNVRVNGLAFNPTDAESVNQEPLPFRQED